MLDVWEACVELKDDKVATKYCLDFARVIPFAKKVDLQTGPAPRGERDLGRGIGDGA